MLNLRPNYLIIVLLILAIGCRQPETAADLPTVTMEPTMLPTATPRPIVAPESTEAPFEPVTDTTFVQWVADETEVAGAQSTLTRMEHGLYAVFNATELEPGEAYTFWWIVFNEPQNCSGGECGLDDGFLMNDEGKVLQIDGEDQMNWEGRARTDMSVHRGTGTLIDVDGMAEFRAHLPIGDVTEAVLRSTGLKYPMTAEVHAFLRTHGMAQPGNIHNQMNTSFGGCPDGWPKTPQCRETQFAIHLPSEQ